MWEVKLRHQLSCPITSLWVLRSQQYKIMQVLPQRYAAFWKPNLRNEALKGNESQIRICCGQNSLATSTLNPTLLGNTCISHQVFLTYIIIVCKQIAEMLSNGHVYRDFGFSFLTTYVYLVPQIRRLLDIFSQKSEENSSLLYLPNKSVDLIPHWPNTRDNNVLYKIIWNSTCIW